MQNYTRSVLQLMFVITMPALAMDCTTTSQTIKNESEKVQTPWLKPGLLNSERIKLKFGSFGVEILSQNLKERYRLSNLYSYAKNQKISRTIAFTTYEQSMDKKLNEAHDEIIQGGSIGSTLSKHGFKLKKNTFFKNNISNMPAKIGELMQVSAATFAAVVYELSGEKDGQEYPYCIIAEVYSPEFLTLDNLDIIYQGNSAQLSSESKVKEGIIKDIALEKSDFIFNRLRQQLERL